MKGGIGVAGRPIVVSAGGVEVEVWRDGSVYELRDGGKRRLGREEAERVVRAVWEARGVLRREEGA